VARSVQVRLSLRSSLCPLRSWLTDHYSQLSTINHPLLFFPSHRSLITYHYSPAPLALSRFSPEKVSVSCALIMHVITRKRLNEFAEKHPDAKSALARWYAIMRKSRFLNFAQLREVFPHADQVEKFTVFNIGGNKVRLIAAVHYNRNKIYIRYVLTHQEYDIGKWKK
jgi:mRNA interferase HigB